MLVFSTHGERNTFRSSIGENIKVHMPNEVTPMLDPDGSGPKERKHVPTTLNHVPDHNLVLYYSCETLRGTGNDNNVFPKAYRIALNPTDPTDPSMVNRAYGGFYEVVHKDLHNRKGTLNDHAEFVLKQLADGATVDLAIREANRIFPPMSAVTGKRISMLHVGDKFATLNSVYSGTRMERSTKWYLVQ